MNEYFTKIRSFFERGVFTVVAGIELQRGQSIIDEIIEAGITNKQAIELLEQHASVLTLDRLQMLWEQTGDEDMHRQLLGKKQKLSLVQLLALQNLTERRIRGNLI